MGAKYKDHIDLFETARANFEKYATIPPSFQDVVALRAVFRAERYLAKSSQGYAFLQEERKRVDFAAVVERRKHKLIRPAGPIDQYRQSLNVKYIFNLTANYILGFIDHCRADETFSLKVRRSDWEYVAPLIKQYLDIDHRDYSWERLNNALLGRISPLRDEDGDLQASASEARILYDHVKSSIQGKKSA